MSSTYRLATPVAARLAGSVLVLGALAVLLTTVLVSLLDGAVGVLLVVGLLAVLATAATAVAVRSLPVLTLDADGYRVRWLRRAGVRRARWRDVEDAVTARLSGLDCVVIRLRDGGTTTVPVTVLHGDRDALVVALRDHLTRGGGLRPL